MKSLVTAVAMVGLVATGFTGFGVTGASAGNSRAYCEQYAKDVSRQETGGNILGGAAVGAIGGAVLGGIFGGGRKGSVGTGAAVGALGGGGLGAVNRTRVYDRAYQECINQKAAPAAYGAPPVGSKKWKNLCSQKYRSFNPATGYYKGYDGDYHLCQIP
ncbi:MAG: BA14K family protein [Bauldia sp.]|uniref:BA14K family protein n=1 Tax=Bauldia sp. TaxID=2575872 RepID=UPI001E0EDE62|nr:BA14K family protein [Bauldia sp.]MCB1496732.1 BA14K family protein [Bauldia sp.]